MEIKVQPIGGAEPLMCNHNVAKRIKACGGTAVYGWEVQTTAATKVECRTNHCVWQDEHGELWDVTPKFSGVEGNTATISWPETTEFVRDDDAVFVNRASSSQYRSRVENRRIERACEFMNIADDHMNACDLDKCRYWTEKANTEIRRERLPFRWDTPKTLLAADWIPTILPGGAFCMEMKGAA